MRVLLLAYHYPPDPAVGSLRAANVARAFRAAGHSVHVITACLADESAGIRSAADGVTVEGVRPLPGARDMYAAVKRRLRGASALGGGAAGAESDDGEVPASVPGWKRFLGSLIWLPDDRQGFIPPAVRAGRRALRSGFDLLYTTAPPFSTLLAGLLLRRPGLRWCLELRDPWTDNPWKPWHVRTGASDAAERVLERRCLASADHIVAVSQGVHDSLRRRDGGALAEKVVLARNGIPRLLSVEATAGGATPFRIMYAGSFYHGRDPMPFLRGLAATIRRLSLGDRAVEVCLAGDCRWFSGQSVEEEVRRLGLERVVEFRDWIPHDECQRLVRAADMLLLLAQDQPLQIPNKLYEYLGTRRPILAFVDADGESASMLRRVGGHHVLDGSSVAECEAALSEAISRRETGRSAVPSPSEAEELLHSWTTRAQMDHLLASVSR